MQLKRLIARLPIVLATVAASTSLINEIITPCAHAAFLPSRSCATAPRSTTPFHPPAHNNKHLPILPQPKALPSPPLFLKRGGTKKKQVKGNTITVNKLAYRNYEVVETLEVGIALRGTEVKR